MDQQDEAACGDTTADVVRNLPLAGAVSRPAVRPIAGAAYNAWLRDWNERMRFAQQACGGE